MRIRSTLTCLPGALVALSLVPGLQAQQDLPETAEPPKDASAPPSAPVGPPNTGRALNKSIVRIEATSLEPDYKNPWNAGRQSGGTGTGFLIGENKFMTNAHVVSNSRQVLIKKYGDPQKYTARLLHVAHDCDLALLELNPLYPRANRDWGAVRRRSKFLSVNCKKTGRTFFKNYYYYDKSAHQVPLLTPRSRLHFFNHSFWVDMITEPPPSPAPPAS